MKPEWSGLSIFLATFQGFRQLGGYWNRAKSSHQQGCEAGLAKMRIGRQCLGNVPFTHQAEAQAVHKRITRSACRRIIALAERSNVLSVLISSSAVLRSR